MTNLKNQLIPVENNTVLLPESPLEMKQVVGAVFSHINSRFNRVEKIIDDSKAEIIQKIEKRKQPKTKASKMVERDFIDFDFYQQIMSQKRKSRERLFSYSQFRVAITLLFFTGARCNEIRDINEKQIYELLQHNIIILNQTKTRSERKIILGQKSKKWLKLIEKDIHTVFFQSDTLGNGTNPLNWLKFVNTRLQKFSKIYKRNQKISSHSFRIGFVTKLLKKYPIHVVRDLVDHQSIQTTLRYSRHRLTDSERADAVDFLLKD